MYPTNRVAGMDVGARRASTMSGRPRDVKGVDAYGQTQREDWNFYLTYPSELLVSLIHAHNGQDFFVISF